MHFMQVESTKWAQDEGEPVFTAENTQKHTQNCL